MTATAAPFVYQVSTSVGVGNFALNAVTGWRLFSDAFGIGAPTDIFYYYIRNQLLTEWEYGSGHMSATNTLVRDTVVGSSNSNALVNFSPGTKDVSCDVAAGSFPVPTGTGIVVQTGVGTSATRTITVTAKQLAITNPGGVAGNVDLKFDPAGITVSGQFVGLTTAQFKGLADFQGPVSLGGTATATAAGVGDFSAGLLKVKRITEVGVDSATAATGTVNFDALTQQILEYTTNASANWTLNVRGDGSNSLDSVMAVNDQITVIHYVKQGGTAYYMNVFKIDSNTITPRWSGGTAPTAGNINSVDRYVITIKKTASATFTVTASQTKLA